MNKTLHKKLTAEHFNAYAPMLSGANGNDLHAGNAAWFQTGLGHEMNILREAAKDLLQPRPEAIARLLSLAKEL